MRGTDDNKEPRVPETMTPEAITEAAEKIIAAGDCAPRLGRDPVNQPMINNLSLIHI